jgi:hypothetical protein
MLDARDLNKERNDIKKKTKQVYKTILEKCYNKIKAANINNQTFITYRLNPIHLGEPLYDITYAIRYLQHKLKKGHFKVTVYSQCSIFIDWS